LVKYPKVFRYKSFSKVNLNDAKTLFKRLIENAAKRLDPNDGILYVHIPLELYISPIGAEIPSILKEFKQFYELEFTEFNKNQITSFTLKNFEAPKK